MKRCPQCGREFDNTMMFCLDDGAELLYGPAKSPASAGGQFSDEPQTAILSEPGAIATGFRDGEAPTRAQINTTDETAVLHMEAEAEPHRSLGGSPEKQSFSARRAKPLAVLVVAAVVLVGGYFGYRYFTAADSGTINSIAVMPFANVGDDPASEYLSQGLSESLIYRLSQVSTLKVSPTSSVMRFKGANVDPLAAGRELGVDAVLFGRITQMGDGLLVSAELVDVRSKSSLWGSHYDRKLTDLLSTQREIAREIAEALKIQVSRESSITKNYTNSNDAYLLQLQGQFLLKKRTKPEMDRALASFQKAIMLDPNFALAYVGVAEAYNAMVPYGYLKPSEAASESRTAAKRALEIDPLLAEAHSAYAYVVGTYDWKWDEAEKGHKRAIELNPGREGPLFYYAASFLIPTGRLDEAEAVLRKVIEIEPDSIHGNVRLATVLRHARKTDEAVAQARKANDMDPGALVGRGELVLCLTQKGLYDEAIRIGEASLVAAPDYPQVVTALGVAYARAGRPEDARKKIDEWETSVKNVAGYFARAARIYTALGDREKAIAALEKAFDERDWFILQARVAPEFDPIRDDPRFAAMLKRMNLPE